MSTQDRSVWSLLRPKAGRTKNAVPHSVADPGSGAFLPFGSGIRIRDKAMVGSGSGIKHPGSATLVPQHRFKQLPTINSYIFQIVAFVLEKPKDPTFYEQHNLPPDARQKFLNNHPFISLKVRTVHCSVVDPKLFFPDPIFRRVLDPDLDPT
jgi:hypothetical protein